MRANKLIYSTTPNFPKFTNLLRYQNISQTILGDSEYIKYSFERRWFGIKQPTPIYENIWNQTRNL